MNSSYLTGNPEILFEQAPPQIKELIVGATINDTTAILGKLYKVPISSYVAFENIISYILIGAILPENAVRAIVDILTLSEEDAYKLAADLDKTILEKARISILGKSPKDMVTLTFQEGRSPDELRKEILDTTKREPVATSIPTQPTNTIPAPVAPVTPAPAPAKKATAVVGSRSQLLEQLQILDTIPTDEEVSERLKKIQEQISGIEAKDDRALDSNIALQEFMPHAGDDKAVIAEAQTASYSKAPTKYNIDPYREASGE